MTATAAPDVIATELLAALPGGHLEALRRCSVLALFDQETYDGLLRPPGGPQLGALVEAQLVEHLSGGDSSCRVQQTLQDVAWGSWFPAECPADSGRVPAGLRAFAGAVAAWCADHGADVERLRALLLLDQRRARTWFRTAFAAHDERDDLAGCTNLLEALREPARSRYVGRALAGDLAAGERYLAARSLWRAAHHSTAAGRYLRRATLEAGLSALLTDGGPRLLRLTGSGGYGKSTLIRWFLARRCVPRRIPCAMVDLDRPLDPVNAIRHPWLLLLEIANQLDDQMAGAPFRALLRDYGSYRHVLYADESAEGRVGAAALGTATGLADAAETVAIFLDALRDAAPPAPVVVLDTVEEAMIRPPADVATFLGTLNMLRSATDLRIVVAGRRTAAETEPTDVRLAEDVELPVPAFTTRQSRRYLATVRHVRPELVPGMVERANGLPWQLALWGDVADAYPQLTPQMLPRVRPEAAWVVDRIVGRIENPVLQWLVRYGVVPRTLRRDFAEHVLLPRIERTVQGSPDDDPGTDARPQGADAVPVFDVAVTLPRDTAEFTDTWNQLTRYASTTSWLWLADGDPDTVVFQPELRNPIRALLAAQPIGGLLHRAAADYYTALAERDHAGWTAWTCEAIYHRFCAGDPDAAARWRAAVGTARQQGLGGEAISRLAGEVLGPEYRRDVDTAAGWPCVDRQTRAAAHAELAWAECRIALRNRLPAGHATWSAVESSLAAADRLGPDPDSAQRQRSARAALNLARNRLELAIPELVELTTSDDGPSVDRCIRLLLLAQAQSATPGLRAEAAGTLARAAATADGLGVSEVSARIAVAIAERAAALGRLDVADRGLSRAAAKHPPLRTDPVLGQARARCALDGGRPATALLLAPECAPIRAEAQLALGDADGAARTCTALLNGLVEPERRTALILLRARAHARVLRVDQAIEDLAVARELCGQLGDIEGAGWCTALAAETMLRDVGNLLETGQYLEEAGRLPLDPGSPAWARCRLLSAELHARRGDQDTANRDAAEALDVVAGRCSDPRLIADVALAAFCWSTGSEQSVRSALRRNLGLVSPPTARLTALDALPDCPPWAWGRRLMKLALPVGRRWDDVQPRDLPWLQLRAVELLRVAGRAAEAAALLDTATDALVGHTPLAGWIWLRAAARPGLPPLAEHPAAARIPESATFPLLAAAQRITLAERRREHGDHAGATALLDAADTDLTAATPRTTVWTSRLHELRQLGEPGTRSAAAPSRAWLQGEASRRQLGHAPQATVAESPEPPPATGAERELLTVALDGAELTLAGNAGTRTLPPDDPMVAALCEEARSSTRSPVVRWVRGQLAQPDGLLALDRVLTAGATELTVLAVDPRVAQLPWELATVGGAPLAGGPLLRSLHRAGDRAVAARLRVRLLQEALAAAGTSPGPIDGLHGPETAAALQRFQLRAGVDPDGAAGELTWAALRATRNPVRPAVLLLQGSGGRDRAAPDRAATDRSSTYRRQGWECHTVGTLDPAEIERLAPPDPLDVLHVVATMQLVGGVPVLGLAEADPLRPETLTCTLLDAVLRRVALRGSTPLVVLDVVAQPHLGEAVRQLVLRNDFAQQLHGLGQCYGILATGPTAADDPTVVAAVVAATATATELARRLQAYRPAPDEALPRAATAFFTSLLADRMPALARPAAPQGRRPPP